eukprot:gnl/TRDRNA2_/TRDRNA2_177800_c0_seq11.p1 gnl/TRDRNA2_/TRDRNA2_177800_c0~~gnl/TRDRNA2_/TRDRNA2_177800_c0_seq11.p1  ORF type:complete len:265 (+),score=52.76 gnl/TRDRNA2_/TRDRNA2_177800_c0_seq11:284-1078(+)
MAMCWTLALLGLLLFIFAIAFVQLASAYLMQNDVDPDLASQIHEYFGSVPKAMLSLYWASTGGESWRYIAEPLQILGWHAHCLLLVYIAFFMFVVVNTLTALFVENSIELAEKDHAKSVQEALNARHQYTKVLKEVFRFIDEDGNGKLSLEEFQKVLLHRDDELMSLAKSLHVEVEDLKTVFMVLSQNGEDLVDVEEFVEGCIRLKGAAKSSDLHGLMHLIKRMKEQMVRMEHLLQNKDMHEHQAEKQHRIASRQIRDVDTFYL